MDAAKFKSDIAAQLSQTNAQIYSWLNEDVSTYARVPHGVLIKICFKYDLIGLWEDNSLVAGDNRRMSKAALQLLARNEGLDLTDPDIVTLLDDMEQATPSLLPDSPSPGSKNSILGAGTISHKRWASLGYTEKDEASWLYWIELARNT